MRWLHDFKPRYITNHTNLRGADVLGSPPQPDLSAEFAARDPDLDPQYIWSGKKPNDINTLETAAPFIYQQEKIFPRMLIEDLRGDKSPEYVLVFG